MAGGCNVEEAYDDVVVVALLPPDACGDKPNRVCQFTRGAGASLTGAGAGIIPDPLSSLPHNNLKNIKNKPDSPYFGVIPTYRNNFDSASWL